jgi:hypothetical protein
LEAKEKEEKQVGFTPTPARNLIGKTPHTDYAAL